VSSLKNTKRQKQRTTEDFSIISSGDFSWSFFSSPSSLSSSALLPFSSSSKELSFYNINHKALFCMQYVEKWKRSLSGDKFTTINTRLYSRIRPARVVQWSNHLGAMCSRAWHAQWLRFGVRFELWHVWVWLLKSNYFKNNSYAHDDQGDNPGQETEGSTVSSINCDRCWHLD